jgi:molybdopterin/thiamine biosynthesis adenylyltransferase
VGEWNTQAFGAGGKGGPVHEDLARAGIRLKRGRGRLRAALRPRAARDPGRPLDPRDGDSQRDRRTQAFGAGGKGGPVHEDLARAGIRLKTEWVMAAAGLATKILMSPYAGDIEEDEDA